MEGENRGALTPIRGGAANEKGNWRRGRFHLSFKGANLVYLQGKTTFLSVEAFLSLIPGLSVNTLFVP